jgi:hypothetical protein
MIPDSHHMLLAPAFARAISPKSNPVRLSPAMSSRDLTGAPKNIIDKTFLLTLLLILLIPEMVFHKSPPSARFIQLNHCVYLKVIFPTPFRPWLEQLVRHYFISKVQIPTG